MNINPVAQTNTLVTNQNFKAKMPVQRIKVANELDGYAEFLLEKYGEKITKRAELYNTVVTVAQKKSPLSRADLAKNGLKENNAIYVNGGGMITSRFDLNNMKSPAEFYRTVVNNIRANSEAKIKGLQAGLDILG